MNRLTSKTAIVTGGAEGIGRACVIRMAEEGAKVAILDLLEAEGKTLAADLMAKGHEGRLLASRCRGGGRYESRNRCSSRPVWRPRCAGE